MKSTQFTIGCLCFAASSLLSNALTMPSSTDLWDISQGTTILGGTSLYPGFAQLNAFGGTSEFSPGVTVDTVVFADSLPVGFTHYVEWQTATTVSVSSFRLFATGDGPSNNNRRDFDSFSLLGRSAGSLTYDVPLYSFIPTHPYSFLDPISFLAVEANIPTYIGTDFRAEFVSRGGGNDGPRVIELDGFSSTFPTSSVPDGGTSAIMLGMSFGVLLSGQRLIRRHSVAV